MCTNLYPNIQTLPSLALTKDFWLVGPMNCCFYQQAVNGAALQRCPTFGNMTSHILAANLECTQLLLSSGNHQVISYEQQDLMTVCSGPLLFLLYVSCYSMLWHPLRLYGESHCHLQRTYVYGMRQILRCPGNSHITLDDSVGVLSSSNGNCIQILLFSFISYSSIKVKLMLIIRMT